MVSELALMVSMAVSTAFSMPLRMTIGFAPAETFFGPRVTFTVLASWSMPDSRALRASSP